MSTGRNIVSVSISYVSWRLAGNTCASLMIADNRTWVQRGRVMTSSSSC